MKSILELPFVTDVKSGRLSDKRCFWDVSPTGDIETDNKTGKDFAALALEYANQAGLPCLVNWMIIDMNFDCRSGIELGFLSNISHLAVLGGES